jgi:hypothetical protein
LQDLVVPETQDFVSSAFQERGAFGIILDRFRMLAAIDLDDQFRAVADNVRVVRPKR